MALPQVRGACRAEKRQRRQAAAEFPEAAVLQGRHSRPEDKQSGALAQDSVGLEDMADCAPATGEAHEVARFDGTWLRRRAVALVAWADGRAAAWHLAQSECSSSWATLMLRIPAPVMAVTDGSPGFAKAAHIAWLETRMQRCAVRAARQARRYTTLNPRLDAGIELLETANGLSDAKDADAATAWLLECNAWRTEWEPFPKEFAIKDGRKAWAHERLRKARGSLDRLVREGALFAFVEIAQEHGGKWPATDNAIENVNARLREMLGPHRGLPLVHRIKAIFRRRYMHAESPLPASEIIRVMPTDDDVDGLFAEASKKPSRDDGAPEEYGTGIDWNEFHMPTEFRQ